jgi:hypothetical protein
MRINRTLMFAVLVGAITLGARRPRWRESATARGQL